MSRFHLLAGLVVLLLPAILPAPGSHSAVTPPHLPVMAMEGPVEPTPQKAPASLLEAIALVESRLPPKLEGEARCLAQAVYFEARSEPVKGQLAVAQVVLNRVESPLWPNSICAVVFQNEHRPNRCQFSFACDGLSDNPHNQAAWQESRLVAAVALERMWRDMSDQATHYHADYVAPYWKDHMRKTAQYGRHVFYQDQRQASLMIHAATGGN
ncbi:hypothetical protein JCM17845_13860 [Iodidimonas gelatinilytica]|uniref:Cell wall hydrolase SleB domain-containing protein n=1 Tax=Iodidimonas gelatinilytica TaxID=1236966 RepID=A0A5A7MXF3_9PROT|nr:cell wall hydrolase [Iodidimonas gelatinilytica]GER00763.1 hypothetical protein JCM17845_13860 [Iodidimonas gelatinilytica]